MKSSKRQRGSVLILMAFVLTLATAWTSSGLERSSTEHRAAQADNRSYRAFHLAEAGLEQTIRNLRTIDGQDDIYAGILPTGTYIVDQPLTVLDVLLYEARIHGTAGNVQRTIDAVLQVTPLSLFRFAMFGDEGVTIGGEARVDSYDSRNGPYDPVANADSRGDVGTNSTAMGGIDLNGNSFFIDGQLSVGPGVASPETLVDGFNDALISAEPPVVSRPEFPLPGVRIPDGMACTDLTLSGSVVQTLPSPGVYCFAHLHVRGGATLTSNGPVTVYLTESLNFEGESTIGVVNDPTKFLFLIAPGSHVTMSGEIEGEANFYGAMYGPDATIAIAGDAVIYGSVVGNEVQMSGDSRLHYDEALADINTLSNEGRVGLRSWREDSS